MTRSVQAGAFASGARFLISNVSTVSAGVASDVGAYRAHLLAASIPTNTAHRGVWKCSSRATPQSIVGIASMPPSD